MSRSLCCLSAVLILLAYGWRRHSGHAKPPEFPLELVADFKEGDTSGAIELSFDALSGKFSVDLSIPWYLLQGWLPEILVASHLVPASEQPAAVPLPDQVAVPSSDDTANLQENQART